MFEVKKVLATLLMLAGAANAAPKTHVLSFGKWVTVQWSVEEGKPLNLKVRPLYLDGRLKEFTFGASHEVTDRLFVVRRAFRVNDALPEDMSPRWEWQPGGWLLVDRVTGHLSPVPLSGFDPYYSTVSWYRDYVAYCGISDDGKKLYAMVGQLGSRKAVLKKPLGEINEEGIPGTGCPTPSWQRYPTRVTFSAGQARAVTYAIRGRAAEVVAESATNDNDEEEADKATE